MKSVKNAVRYPVELHWTLWSLDPTMLVWMASEGLDNFCRSCNTEIRDKIHGH